KKQAAKSQEPTQEIMEPEMEEPEIEKPSIDEINISKKNLKSQYQDKTRKLSVAAVGHIREDVEAQGKIFQDYIQAVNEIEAKVRGKIYSFDDEYGDIKRWILKELELFKDLKLRYEQADAQETQGAQYRLGTVTEREIFDDQELKEEWMDNDKPKWSQNN
ncbi:2473_t:CDS:2, partial [Funneliformis mosseae]